MSSRLVARLYILAAAALFSTGGAAIKATTLNAWQIAGSRAGLAVLFLAVFWGPTVRRRPSSGELWVAMAYAVALPGFVLANKFTTAASTIFLYSTAPLWVLLLAPWLLGERWRRRDPWLMALLLAGAILVLALPSQAQATATNPQLGNWVAAGSGLFWALTILGLRRLSLSPGGSDPVAGASGATGRAKRSVVWGNLFTLAVVAPFALPGPSGGWQPVDGLVVGYLGVAQVGLAYVFLLSGLRQIRAFEVSLILLLEPVLSPVWAWWIHGEQPGRAVMLGGGLIIATLIWLVSAQAQD